MTAREYQIDIIECICIISSDKELYDQCEGDCFSDQYGCTIACGPTDRDCFKKCTDTYIACEAGNELCHYCNNSMD